MLIGLIGLKGSGKSAAADALEACGYARVKFAAPMKAMLRAIGLTDRHIEGDLKEAPCDLLLGKTPRHAMQTLGTEWGRGQIGDGFWISLWRFQVERLLAAGQHVVCDDVRFPNEVEALRALGGRLIRILRPGSASGDVHESERHILALPQDHTILNRGTLDELRAAITEVLHD